LPELEALSVQHAIGTVDEAALKDSLIPCKFLAARPRRLV
jgi:hypothetical protein